MYLVNATKKKNTLIKLGQYHARLITIFLLLPGRSSVTRKIRKLSSLRTMLSCRIPLQGLSEAVISLSPFLLHFL